MQVILMYAVSVLIALILLFVSFKFLLRGNWLIPWVRGTLGLGFILLAVAVVGLSFVSSRLPSVESEQVLALDTVGIELVEGRWQVSFGQQQQAYTVQGESWRVGAELIKLDAKLSWLFGGDYVLLSYLTGHFDSLENEERFAEQPQNLSSFEELLFRTAAAGLPGLVKVQSIQSPMVPLQDGALFLLATDGSELIVDPQNDLAKQIWQ